MNSNPQRALFTIVTVSYNCCSLIEKTIKSVLQQDYHDTEYIIIDGKHSIFRHDNFIGCFSADKIKMSARK